MIFGIKDKSIILTMYFWLLLHLRLLLCSRVTYETSLPYSVIKMEKVFAVYKIVISKIFIKNKKTNYWLLSSSIFDF